MAGTFGEPGATFGQVGGTFGSVTVTPPTPARSALRASASTASAPQATSPASRPLVSAAATSRPTATDGN